MKPTHQKQKTEKHRGASGTGTVSTTSGHRNCRLTDVEQWTTLIVECYWHWLKWIIYEFSKLIFVFLRFIIAPQIVFNWTMIGSWSQYPQSIYTAACKVSRRETFSDMFDLHPVYQLFSKYLFLFQMPFVQRKYILNWLLPSQTGSWLARLRGQLTRTRGLVWSTLKHQFGKCFTDENIHSFVW